MCRFFFLLDRNTRAADYVIMLIGSGRLLLITLFTIALIVLVNVAWWVFYDRTARLLDQQLGHRLTALAHLTARTIPPTVTDGLLLGDVDAFGTVLNHLDAAREADSLAELFVIDENFRYLATTSMEPDTTYFLAELNGPYIDSIFFAVTAHPMATPTYRTGNVYLKSAFAPLYASNAVVAAVIGIEANVDYFDALVNLRRNLYYSSGLSITGGLLFGLLFLWFQRRLNRAQRQLFMNETHAYLGRMVAVVAHEIKNPLMIVRASAERLARKTQAAEAGFIVEEVDRLNQISAAYLSVAKAGDSLLAGQTRERINLREFVLNTQKQLDEKYPEVGIRWIGADLPQDLSIVSYPRALRQLILNLLINSVEASMEASKPVELDIQAREASGRIELVLIDHGPGMSKNQAKRAFEPFYTTKQSGTGLGLYLTRKIIVQMGGDIHIRSRKGRLTQMSITLPKSAE